MRSSASKTFYSRHAALSDGQTGRFVDSDGKDWLKDPEEWLSPPPPKPPKKVARGRNQHIEKSISIVEATQQTIMEFDSDTETWAPSVGGTDCS